MCEARRLEGDLKASSTNGAPPRVSDDRLLSEGCAPISPARGALALRGATRGLLASEDQPDSGGHAGGEPWLRSSGVFPRRRGPVCKFSKKRCDRGSTGWVRVRCTLATRGLFCGSSCSRCSAGPCLPERLVATRRFSCSTTYCGHGDGGVAWGAAPQERQLVSVLSKTMVERPRTTSRATNRDVQRRGAQDTEQVDFY